MNAAAQRAADNERLGAHARWGDEIRLHNERREARLARAAADRPVTPEGEPRAHRRDRRQPSVPYQPTARKGGRGAPNH